MKYCNNCGIELNDDAQFCGNCGAACEVPVAPVYYQQPPQQKSGTPAFVYAIISAFVVLLIAAVIFAVVYLSGGGVELTVDAVPYETSEKNFVLSGTAETKKIPATITVNDNVVDVVTKADGTVYWTYDEVLEKGDNTFFVELIDEKGEYDSETISVYYDGTYPIGTMFVKCVKEGIFVRSAPYKSSKEIVLLDKSDYYSRLEFLGGVETDNQGYDWYQVRTPHHGIGWVRSDIVTPVY